MDIAPHPIGAAALWPLDVWQLGKDLLEGTVLWSQMALGHSDLPWVLTFHSLPLLGLVRARC